MGLLIDGQWRDQWYDTKSTGGRFERQDAKWRDWVTADGTPAPGRTRSFKAEPKRYHLYVSLACPWAHRTLIIRALKKLEDAISVSIVHHFMGENGWTFLPEDGATGDDLYGFDFLHQIYTRADPHFTGRVTVPVLWDRREETIVSNESSEIIRMLNTAFDAWGDASLDFYPEELRGEIDRINAEVYDNVNNGVYKAGFATEQTAYEEAFDKLFATLDQLEERLGSQRFLAGNRITEADWRLFTTLARFDPVLCRPFQVQPPADRRLPQPVRLFPRALCCARREGDGRSPPHQAPLLPQSPDHQSDPHRTGGAGAGLGSATRAGRAVRLNSTPS